MVVLMEDGALDFVPKFANTTEKIKNSLETWRMARQSNGKI